MQWRKLLSFALHLQNVQTTVDQCKKLMDVLLSFLCSLILTILTSFLADDSSVLLFCFLVSLVVRLLIYKNTSIVLYIGIMTIVHITHKLK